MNPLDRDYQKDVKINEHELEKEWTEQPSLYMYYAEAHAEAIYQKDLAKSRLDLFYAKMYGSIKKSWEKYFDTKPTEPAIKEYILQHSGYKEKEQTLIDLTRDVNILSAAKTSMEHRKKALENLVSLKITGFYAEPSANKIINKNTRITGAEKFKRRRK